MTLNDLLNRAKSLGARNTKTRKAIIEILFQSKCPMLASEILFGIKTNRVTVNRTTVYRELNSLVEMGLVSEISIVGKPLMFELNQGHRHHLVCTKCSNIQTVKLRDHLHNEEEHIFEQNKFKVSNHSLAFYGLCKKCQI